MTATSAHRGRDRTLSSRVHDDCDGRATRPTVSRRPHRSSGKCVGTILLLLRGPRARACVCLKLIKIVPLSLHER